MSAACHWSPSPPSAGPGSVARTRYQATGGRRLASASHCRGDSQMVANEVNPNLFSNTISTPATVPRLCLVAFTRFRAGRQSPWIPSTSTLSFDTTTAFWRDIGHPDRPGPTTQVSATRPRTPTSDKRPTLEPPEIVTSPRPAELALWVNRPPGLLAIAIPQFSVQ